MPKRRVWIAVAAVLVLVVAGLPLLAAIILPKDRIVEALSHRIEAASGWRLTVRAAGIHWPPFAIDLKDAVLSGNPAFEDSSRIEIPKARIELDIFQILKNHVRMTKVDIDTPRIALYLARHPDLEAIARGRSGAEALAPKSSALSLSLSGIDVKHGMLAWIDTTGVEVRLEEMAATFDVQAGPRLDRLDIVGNVKSPRAAVILPPRPGAPRRRARGAPADSAAARPIRLGDFDLRGEYTLAFRPGDRTLAITKGKLTLNDLPATLSGMIREVGRLPEYDISIDARDVDIAQLLSLLPKSVLAEKEKLDARGRATIAARLVGSAAPGSVPGASGTVVINESRVAFRGMPGAIDGLRGRVRFSNDRLDIDSLFAAFDGAPFRLSGSVAPLADPRVDLRVAGALPLDMIGRWPVLNGYENLHGVLRLDVHAAGPVRFPREIRLHGRVDLEGVSIKPRAWSAGAEGLSGAMVLDGPTARLERLDGRIGESDFSLSGSIENPLERPSLRASVTSRFLNVDELMRLAAGSAPRGMTPGSSPQVAATFQLPELPDVAATAQIRADSLLIQSIPLRAAEGELSLQDRTLRATLTAREVRVPHAPLTSVRLEIAVRERHLEGRFTAANAALPRVPLSNIAGKVSITPEGVLEITGAGAKVFTGTAGGDVRVQFVNGEPRYTFSIVAQDLEANDFLSHLTPAKNFLYGRLKLNGKFEGAGLTAKEAAAKLKADGAALAVDGRMQPNLVLGEIASVLGVPSLRQVSFRTLQSSFHIENGWLSFEGFDLVEPDARWHLDGRMGFDGALDYHATIILSKALADRALAKLGGGARLLLTAQGELPIDLKIAGSVTNPKVSVDLSGAAGRATEAALREAARQGAGAIGAGGRVITNPESLFKDPGTIGGIIGGIFGRKGKTPATPPARAARHDALTASDARSGIARHHAPGHDISAAFEARAGGHERRRHDEASPALTPAFLGMDRNTVQNSGSQFMSKDLVSTRKRDFVQTSIVVKSMAPSTSQCASRNSFQVDCRFRSGTGSIPCSLLTSSARLSALREPVEHAHRAERVPPARLALAVLHLEVGLARVDVLERPPAIGIPIALDDPDRLGDPLVGL